MSGATPTVEDVEARVTLLEPPVRQLQTFLKPMIYCSCACVTLIWIIIGIIGIRIQTSGICHPGRATVELRGGNVVRLENTAAGDHIRTPAGYEPIIAFTHLDRDATTSFYRLSTRTASIDIVKGHFLEVNGREANPKDVRVGDLLKVAHPGMVEREEAVERIEQLVERGTYHLVTPSGSYYVDGVLASVYTINAPESAAKRFLPYLKLRYDLGLPVALESKDQLMDPFLLVLIAPAPLRPIAICVAALVEILNLVWASFMGKSCLAAAAVAMLVPRKHKA